MFIIDARRRPLDYWSELWAHRELLLSLAWRDVLVRYKQAALGAAWALLRPAIPMVVFALVFGRFAELPSHGVPYALYVLAALLPWQLFATGLADAGNSVIANSALITKVYFPRLVIPLSAMLVNCIDVLVASVLFGLLMIWYGVAPDWRVVFLPCFLAMALAVTTGAGLWVAALNVRYRDFRYVVPVMVQAGLFLTPVAYSSSIVPDTWRLAYAINPLVGIVDGFRWCLLGADTALYFPGVVLSVAITAILLLTGLRYFRRVERQFVDVM